MHARCWVLDVWQCLMCWMFRNASYAPTEYGFLWASPWTATDHGAACFHAGAACLCVRVQHWHRGSRPSRGVRCSVCGRRRSRLVVFSAPRLQVGRLVGCWVQLGAPTGHCTHTHYSARQIAACYAPVLVVVTHRATRPALHEPECLPYSNRREGGMDSGLCRTVLIVAWCAVWHARRKCSQAI